MNKYMFVLTALAAVMVSCNSKYALEYNDAIVNKVKSLQPQMQLTDQEVKKYMAENNYDSVAIVAEKMENLIESKLQEVENLPAPDVNNAADFKKSVINYFTYIKQIYSNYKKFGLAKEGFERKVARSVAIATVQNKDTIVNQMQRIQMVFAQSNGFKINDGSNLK